jgi:hypothetical protein
MSFFISCLIRRPCRDLSTIAEGKPLTSVGSISAHTRPITALSSGTSADGRPLLFTGDSMGVIKAWALEQDGDRWRANAAQAQPTAHRTGLNGMFFGQGKLWTGASAAFSG